MGNGKQTLTVKQASEELGVCINTCYKLLRNGTLPSIILPGKKQTYLISKVKLQDFINGNGHTEAQ